jgi:hypothetical protein
MQHLELFLPLYPALFNHSISLDRIAPGIFQSGPRVSNAYQKLRFENKATTSGELILTPACGGSI